jgi:hypothetical protein
MLAGSRALVLTQTEVDTTGKSYFGETNLYFLDAQGKHDCRVALGPSPPRTTAQAGAWIDRSVITHRRAKHTWPA